MKKITYNELKKMWLSYLAEKGHTIIPGAKIVPENDPSTLFTTAGMQPLVPYLLGEKHPGGKRIANIQRCIRTVDIDEVGDHSHCTFFEMMGNWSLGDYFKKEKVAWSFEFLTSPKYLGIPVDRLHVTCFEGDSVAARDEECAKFWEQQGIPKSRIHFLNKKENWWAMASGLGPQGPCSEMFYDSGSKCTIDQKKCNPSCDCGRFTELGNDVYMQYVGEQTDKGIVLRPATQKNVDTGWGLERILIFANGHKSVYETELFAPVIRILEECVLKSCGSQSDKSMKGRSQLDAHLKTQSSSIRIIAEHTRAACAIIADGVVPSNTGAGYILRRLIRRAVRNANANNIPSDIYNKLIAFYNTYLEFDAKMVTEIFTAEVTRFEKTLSNGLKEFAKLETIDGKTAFHLYETYGFPIELTIEMAKEKGITVDMKEYEKAKQEHTDKSREASATAGAFKGGLADSCVETVRLHTAAHILLATLRKNFGTDVVQKGSNITPERLRFDFSFSRKIEPIELEKIEREINEIIAKQQDVTCTEMSVQEAQKLGAVGTFGDRYGERVKVYTIGKDSCEICGGPHIGNTRELGTFKIQKEEGVGTGIRRIKAIFVGNCNE